MAIDFVAIALELAAVSCARRSGVVRYSESARLQPFEAVQSIKLPGNHLQLLYGGL